MQDPVVAYTALNATEAHLVAAMLVDAGVPAEVVDDISGVGVWWGGMNSSIHKPRVYVDRADGPRAVPVIAEYGRLTQAKLAPARDGDPVAVICDECGTATTFPPEKRGTVERCPSCRAYVDVGDDEAFDGWAEGGPAPDDPAR